MRFPGAQVMLGLSSMALWVRIPLAAPRGADAAAQPVDGALALPRRACSSVRPNRGTCRSGLTPSGKSPHHDLLAPARLCASLDRAPACGAWVGALRMGASCDTAETRWTCPCPPWRMRGRGRHSRPFGTSRRRPQGAHGRVRAGAHDPADAWEWWHRVRCLCGHNAKLGVLLDLPLALPPEQYVARWRVRQRAAAPWARHVHSQ